MANKLGKIIFKTAGLLSLVGYHVYQTKVLRNRITPLFYPNLPEELEGYRIVHISDLHGAFFGKDNEKLARQIMALEPDILCMTGDMVHSFSDDGEAFLKLVAGLDKRLVKLFVSGNHENLQRSLTGYQVMNRSVLYKKLENYNVRLLDGASYQPEGLPLIFSGIADDHDHYQGIQFKEEHFDIERLLPEPKKDFLNVALIHRPNYFRSVAKYGYDLMLSGHTHGGIIRIYGKGGLLSPERKFFPELDKGLFYIKNSYLNVSSGLGQIKAIPRVENQPEVNLLVLHKGPRDLTYMKPVKDHKDKL